MPTYVYECEGGHRLELTFPSWDQMRIAEQVVEELGLTEQDIIVISQRQSGKEACKQFICQQCGKLLKRQVTAPAGFKGL